MKFVVGALCLALIIAASAEEVAPEENLKVPTAVDYHTRIGIPTAAALKKWEDENYESDTKERIVNGWHVDIGHFPYQAGLIIHLHGTNAVSLCGATLITHYRLVTAAHCWGDNVSGVTVVLGSNYLFHGGHRVWTNNIAIYPSWNPSNLHADIAVLRTNHISYGHGIQPIALPYGEETWWNWHGWWSSVTGYGGTGHGGDPRLHGVDVQIMNRDDCARFYGHWFHSNNICTSGYGGRGPCGGDSGGPLTVHSHGRRVLVGAVSYGSWNGCSAGDPSVYAFITPFIGWIWSV